MNSQLDFITGKIDCFRAKGLSHLLKPAPIRGLYRHTASRLTIGFILTLLFYFPLAILYPSILLIAGPLIFGYPHLIASFRYVQKKTVWPFIIFTFVCILGHLYLTQLPFGVWQVIVAGVALVVIRPFSLKQMLPPLLFCLLLVRLAYFEPIMFIGGSLILHNWVGFFYWIKAAKTKARKGSALISLGLFFLAHVLVLIGSFDAYFPSAISNETMTTGWYLASWSKDPNVWYRLIVLYALGLSVHYYVWLQAIPQSLNPNEHPNSFRVSFKYLREDLGKNTLRLLLLLSSIGVLVWLFSFDWGSRIYFECAILHGYLELVFLFSKQNQSLAQKS